MRYLPTTATLLALVAVLLWATPPATAETLYEQGPSNFGFHPTSQDFEATFDADDSLAADDFRIPAGEVWQVERVLIDGRKPFNSEGGTTSSVHTFLFDGNGTVPAETPFYAQVLSGAPATAYPDFDLALPGVPLLPAGDWWLGAQPEMAFAPGSDADPSTVGSYWVWGTDPDLSGSPAAWRNPGGGSPSGCTTFGLMTTCADTVGSDVTNPDLSFRIEGTRAPGIFEVTSAKAGKKGKLVLTVNAPNTGTLSVTGKAVKPANIGVASLGEVVVSLKPTSRTKQKLKKGKRPKANLTLALPPYFDGTPLEATFAKKLKR